MKLITVLITAIVISGCTQFAQEKWSRYQEAAHMAGNPDEIHIEYHRKGDDTSFYEWRCSGDKCPDSE